MYKCNYCGRYLKNQYDVCPGCGSSSFETKSFMGEKVIKTPPNGGYIIQTKDFVQILSVVIEVYPTIYSEVSKCLNQEIQLFSPMRNLENKKPSECVAKCYQSCHHLKKYFDYAICADKCIRKNCRK